MRMYDEHRSLETEQGISETEREWGEADELAEPEDFSSMREESERAWDIERQLKKMSEREMSEFISGLPAELKGKLWQALEDERND